jgi:hypothetical protein
LVPEETTDALKSTERESTTPSAVTFKNICPVLIFPACCCERPLSEMGRGGYVPVWVDGVELNFKLNDRGRVNFDRVVVRCNLGAFHWACDITLSRQIVSTQLAESTGMHEVWLGLPKRCKQNIYKLLSLMRVAGLLPCEPSGWDSWFWVEFNLGVCTGQCGRS